MLVEYKEIRENLHTNEEYQKYLITIKKKAEEEHKEEMLKITTALENISSYILLKLEEMNFNLSVLEIPYFEDGYIEIFTRNFFVD